MGIGLYFSMFAWVIGLGFIADRKITFGKHCIDGKKAFMVLAFLMLGFFMCFRSTAVGTDTYNYAVNVYGDVAKQSFNDLFEHKEFMKGPLYWLFLWFVGQISSDPQMYVFVTSLMITLGMARFIYKLSPSVAVSVFLFMSLNIYCGTFNTTKQYMSIMLALNAFCFLYESSKSWKGWLSLTASIFVHFSTAFFLIPTLFMIISKRANVKTMLLLSAVSTVAILVGTDAVFHYFIEYVDAYSFYDKANNPWALDAVRDYGVGIWFKGAGFMIVWFIYTIGLCINPRAFRGSLAYAIFPTVLMYVGLMIILREYTVFSRVLMPMQALQIIFIPAAMQLCPKFTREIFYFIMYIGLIAYSSWGMSIGGEGVFPYTFGF